MPGQNTAESFRGPASGLLSRIHKAVGGLWTTLARSVERAPLRFAIVAVLVLQALVVMVFRPSYATNDDVFISMIASGTGICPAPDAHLIFTNVLIGAALQQLYTISPLIPWYGCYLLLVHYAAQVALFYCALTIGGHDLPGEPAIDRIGQRFGLYVLYYVLVELPLLNRFQFTTTAFIAAQAGIFLLLLAWQRRTSQKEAPTLGLLCASVFLVLAGGLIRIESLEMAVLVGIPVTLWSINKNWRQAVVPCGIALMAAGVLVVAAVTFDRSTYEQDPAWQGFRELNQLRGKFHDGRWTYYSPETAAIFSRIGWSENDHAMIANWFSDDPVLYSKENLATIVNAYPWRATRRTSDIWWQAFRTIIQNRSVMSLLLVLPFALAIVTPKQGRWPIGLSLLMALGLIVFVTWNQKVPPERVYLPLLSLPLAASLLSFAWPASVQEGASSLTMSKGSLPRPRPALLVTALLVLAIAIGIDRQVRQSAKVARGRAQLESFVREAGSTGHKLYVSWEAALPYELVSPLDNLRAWSRFPLLSLAWTQRTRWAEETKRRFGFTDLARAICDRDDIVLIATPLHRDLFTTFAKEHFGADLVFAPTSQIGETCVAGSFHRQAASSTTANRSTGDANR
jgi:hypothetical protein